MVTMTRAEHMASHWGARDALAFVFNEAQRERFRTAIRDAVSSGVPVALVAFDLDNFKQVNDRYGHLAGDDVLRAIAAKIHKFVRKFDVVGRYVAATRVTE